MKNSRLDSSADRLVLRSCAVDSDRYKVVFRHADLRNASIRSPPVRTLAHHGRRWAPAAVNRTRQVGISIQMSCCGGTNYCKDCLNRDQIHAIYFRVSSLISSFDLGLRCRLPSHPPTIVQIFSETFYCSQPNQKAAFRRQCFLHATQWRFWMRLLTTIEAAYPPSHSIFLLCVTGITPTESPPPSHRCHHDSPGPGCTLAHPRVLGSGLHLWRVRSKLLNDWIKNTNCIMLCVRCMGVLDAVNRSYVDTASVRLWLVTLVSSIEESVRISCNFVQELLTKLSSKHEVPADRRQMHFTERSTGIATVLRIFLGRSGWISVSGISTRLRVSTRDVGYLHSITCVYTWCRLSPFDYGCLNSMSGNSTRLRMSALDDGYFHSITGVYTRLRVSTLDVRYFHSITSVYTRCPISPLDYKCLYSMSDICNRLRVSTLDVRYLQSITGVYTRCSVSPFAYGCLHSMSGISNRLWVCTLDIQYLQWITGVYTWCPVSPID